MIPASTAVFTLQGGYAMDKLRGLQIYEKLGMKRADDVMQYNKIEWTAFKIE